MVPGARVLGKYLLVRKAQPLNYALWSGESMAQLDGSSSPHPRRLGQRGEHPGAPEIPAERAGGCRWENLPSAGSPLHFRCGQHTLG